ncbi:MAG: phage minor head protein [Campylobacterales bacterium]|nr:phage minor head protein [Campylobacterales bacterium]
MPKTQQEIDLAYVVTLPPKEAIKYFEQKGYKYSWDWQDMWQEAHAKAFTVAKAMRMDILKDIRGALDSAMKEGKSFQTFKKELEPILKSKGWWGKVKNEDGSVTQLGSPYRLRTIYNTNMRTAYAAGQEKSFMDGVDRFPYIRYNSLLYGKNRRQAHVALHGKIFRYDDPFWNAYSPPNGFGCKCTKEQLSERYVKRNNLSIEDSKGKISTKDVVVSYKTGEVGQVSVYKTKDANGKSVSVATDAGWNYNPGKNKMLWDNAGSLPDCLGSEFADSYGSRGCIRPAKGQKTWQDYGLQDLRKLDKKHLAEAPKILPSAKSTDEAIKQLRSSILGDKKLVEIVTPIEKMIITAEHLAHVPIKRGDARERYAEFILPTLQKPLEIWTTMYEDGKYRQRYIALFNTPKALLISALRVNIDGSLFWNMMQTDLRRMNSNRYGTYMKKFYE